jgi:hypothetical protein
VNDRRGEAATLSNLAMVARLRGDARTARRMYRTSLAVYRDLDLVEGVLDAVEGLAGIAAGDREHERALRLFVVTEQERARLGAPVFIEDELADHAQPAPRRTPRSARAAAPVMRAAATDSLEAAVARLLDDRSVGVEEADCRMSVTGV